MALFQNLDGPEKGTPSLIPDHNWLSQGNQSIRVQTRRSRATLSAGGKYGHWATNRGCRRSQTCVGPLSRAHCVLLEGQSRQPARIQDDQVSHGGARRRGDTALIPFLGVLRKGYV